MPPLPGAAKRKHKEREPRRSRSRNTTPSSVISTGTAPPPPATHTPWLDLETSKLMVMQTPQYSDILDQLEIKPSNVEQKRLPEIIDQLKKLSDHAEQRVESCEKAIRLIHEQMRDVEAEHKERERQAEQTRRTEAKKASQKNTKAKREKTDPSRQMLTLRMKVRTHLTSHHSQQHICICFHSLHNSQYHLMHIH